MTFALKPIFILGISSILLASCSDLPGRSVDANTGRVDIGLSRLGDRAAVRAGGAQFSDGIFVGATPERDNASALLPSNLQAPAAVRLQSRDAMTLEEIAQRLSQITNLPHLVALGPTGKISTGADSSEEPGASNNSVTAELKTSEQASQTREQRLSKATLTIGQESQITMRPNLKGPLSDILDEVGSTFDVEWDFEDGRVIFRDFITRKYQISALPSTTQASSSIGSNAILSSSALATDVWSEVRSSIEGMVGDSASISIGSATGLVTVTARVSDQNRVAEYIKQLNGNIGQQISFDVNVLTVVLDEGDEYGVDINSAFNGTFKNGAIGNVDFNAAAQPAGEAGTVNIGLIRGGVDIGAIVKALSRQGKVSVETRAGATTSNNRMAPIEVVNETAYLQKVSGGGFDGNGNPIEPERTPGTITTGFQMQLFPRVLNNREIMVQYTVRLSELNDIKTFGDGNNAIQLPEVSKTSFEQQALLENGQTLVLAGFERSRAESSSAGTVGGGFLGLGGAKSSSQQRVATVLMITPRIVGRASAVTSSN